MIYLDSQVKEEWIYGNAICTLCSFCLDAKRTKKIIRRGGPPAGQASAHEQSLYFMITSFFRTDSSKRLLRVMGNLRRRCLFRLHSLEL